MDDYKQSLKWNRKITDDKMLSLCEENVDARAKCSDLSYTCALQEKLCIDFCKDLLYLSCSFSTCVQELTGGDVSSRLNIIS